jgi:hypothetical protein
MSDEQKAEAARLIAQLEEVGTEDPLKNPLIFGGGFKKKGACHETVEDVVLRRKHDLLQQSDACSKDWAGYV